LTLLEPDPLANEKRGMGKDHNTTTPKHDEALDRWTRLSCAAVIVFGCSALGACGTVDPPLKTGDFQEREDCLYATTCRLIGERGAGPDELEGIATSSTAMCSAALWKKMQRQTVRQTGTQMMNDQLTDEETDRIRTEPRALSIALEQSKNCEVQPPPSWR
jgi:hypothetical protein